MERNIHFLLLEFTEAVTTEDHELQRTYGAVAAFLSGAYYVKIAGNKLSEKVFGGASYNPFSTPKIFIDEASYEGYIIAKWDTMVGNAYTLERNSKYPSCPPDITLLGDTIFCAVSAFLADPKGWYCESLECLKKSRAYVDYRKSVDKAGGSRELLESWKKRRNSNLNKVRFFVQDGLIAAKINRFSHAMDPDRGVLTFISFLFSGQREIYGVYALVRPRGGDVMKKDLRTIAHMA